MICLNEDLLEPMFPFQNHTYRISAHLENFPQLNTLLI